jgi:hypothetical protein
LLQKFIDVDLPKFLTLIIPRCSLKALTGPCHQAYTTADKVMTLFFLIRIVLSKLLRWRTWFVLHRERSMWLLFLEMQSTEADCRLIDGDQSVALSQKLLMDLGGRVELG